MIASSAGRRGSALDACDGGQLAAESILLGFCCPRLECLYSRLGCCPRGRPMSRLGESWPNWHGRGWGTKLAFVAAGRRKRATYPTNQATIHKKKKVSRAPSHRVCRRWRPPEAGDIHCRVWATAASRCGRGMLAGGGGAILRWAGIDRSVNQWEPGSQSVIDVAAAELSEGGRGG